jgi:hypothetical protein
LILSRVNSAQRQPHGATACDWRDELLVARAKLTMLELRASILPGLAVVTGEE